MLVTLSRRGQCVTSALAAVVFAELVVRLPTIALALAATGVLVTLAFVAPVANLVLIVFTTAVVPFSVQTAIRGGSGSAIPTDLMLLAALARAALDIGRLRLTRRQRGAMLTIVAFLIVTVLQFLRGISAGHDRGTTGFEFRTLFAFCTFIIALPILADEKRRRRLLDGLLVAGIALGLWGLAQWVLGLSFEAGFGVKEGVSHAASGTGQLQGGLYGFPIAAVVAFAVLNSGQVHTRRVRTGLLAAMVLNLVSLLLTYERTFWVATAIAFVFIVIKGGRRSRARALVSMPAVVLLAIGLLLTPSPQVLVAARERLYSLGDYRTDNSVQYRIIESEQVFAKIRARPIDGQGLGATVFYARPRDHVPARAYHYTHNGYLWLAWKVGTPAAVMLWVLIAMAISQGRHPDGDHRFAAVRDGSQAGLLLLMVVNVAFPTFNTYGITAVMGLLVAFSFAPPPPSYAVAPRNDPDRASRAGSVVG